MLAKVTCGTCLAIFLVACAAGAPIGSPSPPPAQSPTAPIRLPTPTGSALRSPNVFPTAAFTGIRETPLSAQVAATLQAVLDDTATSVGMTATLMSAGGTWSSAVGKADGTRDLGPDDQMAIGSITKSVVAAQVMQLVASGDLALEDRASDYLPAGIDFDTNDATIRQLLGMRSGLPDFDDALWTSLSTDQMRSWTSADALDHAMQPRLPAGGTFVYSNPNYMLLGLIIEQVTGRPVADVLRDGVLSGASFDRLAYQPDDVPSGPMAMPDGSGQFALALGGGYLPSLAAVTAVGAAGGMAADAPTLARWWSRFCSGEVVSEESLVEMTSFGPGDQYGQYGLGILDGSRTHGRPAIGHGGMLNGFTAWAMCLVEDGSVVVVLANGDGEADLVRTVAVALADDARSN